MTILIGIQEIEARAGALGLSLRDLAADAGLAKSTVYRWQKGQWPSLRCYQMICDALHRRERSTLKHLSTVLAGEHAGVAE